MIADTLLADIQPELAGDPQVANVMRALGNEMDRIEAAADALRSDAFPATATDEYGILSVFERLFRLPVAPEDATLEQRRERVVAHFRKRVAGAGSDWQDALSAAMGSLDYRYQEGPTPNTVTIRYAFQSGALSSAVVQSFVREITPAHIQVLATYSQGFIVGVSLVGDPL